MSYAAGPWIPAPVTGSGYRATITVPSSALGTAALRVAITDASGSTLTETMRGALLPPPPDRRPATGEVGSASAPTHPRRLAG